MRITDEEIKYIIDQKENSSLTWFEITVIYNKKFKQNKDFEAVKKIYYRNRNYFDQDFDNLDIIKKKRRLQKSNCIVSRENRTILDFWTQRDDIIDVIENVVKKVSLTKYKIPKSKKKDNKKDDMTLELLLSDVHFGKLVKDNNDNILIDAKEIRKRIRKISSQIIKEIGRNEKYFNIDKLIIGVLGDMIESALIHGEESLKGCEYGTSRQVYECIESVFYDLLLPISHTGIKIQVCCVGGNHDRPGAKKTYVRPGEEHFTFIIYKTLELLCKNSGLNNISFDITAKNYISAEVYGNTIVYEHGDELKNLNRDTLMNLMNKRQNQLGKIVNFYRVGHWHEHVNYGQGRIQVNACVPGLDDYAESKGFLSEALQLLNYYVKTDKRRTCFFKSFPIYLDEIK